MSKFSVLTTSVFRAWRDRLRDQQAKRRILARLFRLEDGHFGDVKPVGEGVSEMRIDAGPGYRIYFIRRGATVVVLLCGGDKSSQGEDIRSARRLAKDPEVDNDA